MTTTSPSVRGRTAAALATALLVAVLAGCSTDNSTAGIDSTAPAPSTVASGPSASTGSMRIVLRFGDEFASATLSDTPAAREFATMLPLQLKLRDPMGQAKSGSMPRQINAAGGEPVFNLTWWSLRMLGLRPLSSLALQVHLRS